MFLDNQTTLTRKVVDLLFTCLTFGVSSDFVFAIVVFRRQRQNKGTDSTTTLQTIVCVNRKFIQVKQENHKSQIILTNNTNLSVWNIKQTTLCIAWQNLIHKIDFYYLQLSKFILKNIKPVQVFFVTLILAIVCLSWILSSISFILINFCPFLTIQIYFLDVYGIFLLETTTIYLLIYF